MLVQPPSVHSMKWLRTRTRTHTSTCRACRSRGQHLPVRDNVLRVHLRPVIHHRHVTAVHGLGVDLVWPSTHRVKPIRRSHQRAVFVNAVVTRPTTQHTRQDQLSMWTTFDTGGAWHGECKVLVAVRCRVREVRASAIKCGTLLNVQCAIGCFVVSEACKLGSTLLQGGTW